MNIYKLNIKKYAASFNISSFEIMDQLRTAEKTGTGKTIANTLDRILSLPNQSNADINDQWVEIIASPKLSAIALTLEQTPTELYEKIISAHKLNENTPATPANPVIDNLIKYLKGGGIWNNGGSFVLIFLRRLSPSRVGLDSFTTEILNSNLSYTVMKTIISFSQYLNNVPAFQNALNKNNFLVKLEEAINTVKTYIEQPASRDEQTSKTIKESFKQPLYTIDSALKYMIDKQEMSKSDIKSIRNQYEEILSKLANKYPDVILKNMNSISSEIVNSNGGIKSIINNYLDKSQDIDSSSMIHHQIYQDYIASKTSNYNIDRITGLSPDEMKALFIHLDNKKMSIKELVGNNMDGVSNIIEYLKNNPQIITYINGLNIYSELISLALEDVFASEDLINFPNGSFSKIKMSNEKWGKLKELQKRKRIT